MLKMQAAVSKSPSLNPKLTHLIKYLVVFTSACSVLTGVVDVFVHCLVNLFQSAQAAPPVEQLVKMTTTTSTSVQPPPTPLASPQKLPIMLSEKTTEEEQQQQSQQQSQQQQQQQDVEDSDEKAADVDASRRKSETDMVLLCTSEPGRFIKRRPSDTKTANESQESLCPETQPDSKNTESPASFLSSLSNQSDSNSAAANLKQPTVVLQPLDLGGRASIRLQSLEEEGVTERKDAVPFDSNKPDDQANVNSTNAPSERKRHRSASEVEASGQVFLTASPRKRPKKSTSSEPEPVQCHSENNKSDKELLPVTVTDPRDTEEKGVSPKERSRSLGTENGSSVIQQYQDSTSSASSSRGKYKSSKGRTKQRSADLEAHSPEKPGLKLLIRSKPSSTTSEFTSSVVDPYKFDDSEEGASHSGDVRSQKRKASNDNDLESDGSHGSSDHVKNTKEGQSPKKLKVPR